MLRRKEVAQIVAATGWQPLNVRGAFAGALKRFCAWLNRKGIPLCRLM